MYKFSESVMKNLALLVSFILSTIFVWSVNPVPYSGKISIRGVNYDGDAQFTFSLRPGMEKPVGGMETRRMTV